MEKRKESIAIQSIASTANSSSPAKILPQNISSFKETKENLANKNNFKENLKDEEKAMLINEDGWQQKSAEKKISNTDTLSKIKLKLRERDSNKEKIEKKQDESLAWNIQSNSNINSTHLLSGILNSEFTKNVQPLNEDFDLNTFDWFVNFNTGINKLERKMTRDEPKLQINFLDSNLILGDEMFPLFNLY